MQVDFSLLVIYWQPHFLRSLQGRGIASNLGIVYRLIDNALRPVQP
jgi:hypothetical protein